MPWSRESWGFLLIAVNLYWALERGEDAFIAYIHGGMGACVCQKSGEKMHILTNRCNPNSHRNFKDNANGSLTLIKEVCTTHQERCESMWSIQYNSAWVMILERVITQTKRRVSLLPLFYLQLKCSWSYSLMMIQSVKPPPSWAPS